MSQSVPDEAELSFSVTSYLRHLHDEKYFGKGKTGKMKVKELIGQEKGAKKVELCTAVEYETSIRLQRNTAWIMR